MTEEYFVDFKCPYCTNSVSFPYTQIGTPRDCPNCLETLVVPKASNEYGGKFPIPTKTRRLILRRLKQEDWNDLVELMSDAESFRYIDWQPLDEQEVERWLETDKTIRITQSKGHLCLGIEISEIARLIGFVSLYYADEDQRQAGFTVMINHTYRRHGYGTEALYGLFSFGFIGINLHRFTVGCDSRNIAACGLLSKAGMRREGEFVKDQYVKGEWVNTVWYALLKEEHEVSVELNRSQKPRP